MSFLSLGLVVLAALIHATWNLLAKRAAHAGVAFVFAYNLVATIAYAPWVAWVLLTEGMAWSGAAVGFIFLSALIHLAYSLCLQRGYQVADLSVVYPDRQSVGLGKSVSVRVDLGGRRTTKKKKQNHNIQ